jgi:hypothetical protein
MHVTQSRCSESAIFKSTALQNFKYYSLTADRIQTVLMDVFNLLFGRGESYEPKKKEILSITPFKEEDNFRIKFDFFTTRRREWSKRKKKEETIEHSRHEGAKHTCSSCDGNMIMIGGT